MNTSSLRRPHFALTALSVTILASAATYWHFNNTPEQAAYKFSKIESGPLTAIVAATGTLNPVISVQVGSQVSGQIKEILADFNTPVKAGQLIARLDPETFQLRVRQAEADLDAGRAAIAVQRAQLARTQAAFEDAQRDLERKQQLLAKNFISIAERDKAQTAFDLAKADRQVSAAQLQNSQASLRQRESQLSQAKVDLERTAIRSPVEGVVVKRSVDTGQTVAASLQAPELFIIARNLTDMQVEAAIDEADIGRIHMGQKATFTVDAFAGRTFTGKVLQIRKAAQIASNVVSYTVIISAANPEQTLLPGMTANVRIVVDHKDKVLKVSNAALRFRPNTGNEDQRKSGEKDKTKPAAGSKLWLLDKQGKTQALNVRLGLNDGSMTEILDGSAKELVEGLEVIAGNNLRTAPKAHAPTGPRFP